MKLTKEIKQEILDYLIKNGFGDIEDKNKMVNTYKNHIYTGMLFETEKGKKNKLRNQFEGSHKKHSKYFVEYIGQILRKHKITKIYINTNNKLESIDWNFNNIKHTEVNLNT